MLALTFPILLGLLAGLLAGGRLDGWARIRLATWLPALAALAVQLVLFMPPLERAPWAIAYGPALYVASMLLIAAALLWNARAPLRIPQAIPKDRVGTVRTLPRLALATAAAGVLLNCLVVALNGGYMPRVALAGRVPVPNPAEAGRLVNVAPMTDATRLAWLGDVLPEPGWLPLTNVVSVGDLLLAGGLGVWSFALTAASWRSPRTRTPREPRKSRRNLRRLIDTDVLCHDGLRSTSA